MVRGQPSVYLSAIQRTAGAARPGVEHISADGRIGIWPSDPVVFARVPCREFCGIVGERHTGVGSVLEPGCIWNPGPIGEETVEARPEATEIASACFGDQRPCLSLYGVVHRH